MGPKRIKRSRSNSDDDDFDPNDLTFCRGCKKTFKSVLTHIKRTKLDCKSYYTEAKQNFLKEKSTKRSKRNYDKNNAESIAKKQAEYNKAHRIEIRKSQAVYNSVHREERRQAQAIYRKKHKVMINSKHRTYYLVNREKILEKRKKESQKAKDKLTFKDRLYNFRMDIIDGPNYICCSCKRSLFKTGVKFLDENDVKTLQTKHNLDTNFLREVGLEGYTSQILCHNCHVKIKKKICPSNNEQNGLILEEVPDELQLEDLEQQLIARSLLFIKVKKLPRTQMRAMKDRVINVPLENDDVTKTLSTLPRHPDEAHLVAV